jgi:hypothetical protein
MTPPTSERSSPLEHEAFEEAKGLGLPRGLKP